MIDDLTPVMARLPEPAPPVEFRAAVMARIAREADQEPTATSRAETAARRRQDRLGWVLPLAGLAIVLCAILYGWLGTGPLPDFTSSRIGSGGVNPVPAAGPIAPVLGFGVLLYLAGLFAPIQRGTGANT